MNEDLKAIAAKAKQQHEEEKELEAAEAVDENIDSDFEVEEDESAVDAPYDDDDDDASIVIGGETGGVGSLDDVENALNEEDDDDTLDDTSELEISDDDLKAEMPDLDETAFAAASGKIKGQLEEYRKSLIIKSGLTFDEATTAAMNRMKKLAKEENDMYLSENPNLGIIEIDKKNVDKIEFTKEEKEKLTKVKAIKLKVVEDVDLKTIPVERVDKKHKASMLQSLDINLSHYSVPLPLMSDYCKFNGSQIIQLIQAVRYDDATLDEVITKKASLIYSQITNSATIHKYNPEGKTIMSYKDFVNMFKYHDIDMALFGILVASSMEEIESSLTCGQCNESFQWKYNLKTLLNLDDLNDDFKEKFETILEHKTDELYLTKLAKDNNVSIRVQSPLTNNIYEINYPTIARAVNLFQMIDQKDETMLYLSAFALFISKMYVFNKKTKKYIEIEEDEYKELLETLQAIPQEDVDMIQEFLHPYMYAPKFILKTECPVCGHKMTNELTIDDLVFLRARDSSTEIQS